MVYGEDIQESGQCVYVVAQTPVTLYTEYLKNICIYKAEHAINYILCLPV